MLIAQLILFFKSFSKVVIGQTDPTYSRGGKEGVLYGWEGRGGGGITVHLYQCTVVYTTTISHIPIPAIDPPPLSTPPSQQHLSTHIPAVSCTDQAVMQLVALLRQLCS